MRETAVGRASARHARPRRTRPGSRLATSWPRPMGSVGTARWVARGGSAAFALVLATALHGQPAAADRLDAAAIPARPAPADSLPIPILDATASAGERA